MKLTGFKSLRCIHEDRRIIIYRGIEEGGEEKPVIIKTLRSEFPTINDLATLRREYNLLSNLKLLNVIQAYSLKPNQHSLLLVLEDIGGITLKEFLAEKPLNLDLFFTLAIELVRTLGDIHHQNIIHKDIKSENIIIHPKTHHLKISDFSISSQLDQEEQEILNPNVVEGTLQYISPEQTGRMNRSLDYRTDFYSMGIVFYEMLSGHVPFVTEDLLELIHSHIAKLPPSLDDSIPKQLSKIVYKMLSKGPEDRYFSAKGIISDLERCQKEWKETGKIEPFELGKEDLPERLTIAQKLYGREAEIQILLGTFERVSKGACEALFIQGFSGIGKSSLVAEVHRMMTKERGTFLVGKFDQLQRATPYSAFSQALQEWSSRCLAQTEEKLEGLRQDILNAVGHNGQVIVDLVPSLELIIGKQPVLPKVGAIESQNRFMITFQNFIRVLSSPENPLVIFLDDLQWADLGSLRLIEWLLTDPGMHNYFFIGAYRDNEVDVNHPLFFTIRALEKLDVTAQSISLKPLKKEDITALIQDSLRVDEEKADPLAQLLFEKTGGNPFFVNEFLKMLYRDKLLTISYETHSWTWDLSKIAAQATTENVVDLMINNIEKLPIKAQELLKTASCVGNMFDLQTLAIVSANSLEYVVETLWEILKAGYLLPLNNDYKLLSQLKEADLGEAKIHFKFLHDRVQQAAYQMIPKNSKKQVHLLIGRLLMKEPNASTDGLFDLLGHFNKSLSLVTNDEEKRVLAEFNLKAGKKAKLATAYQSARLYLRSAIVLLPNNSWQENYQFAFDLYKELVECEYLLGNIEETEKIFNLLLKLSKTKLDKIQVYRIKIQMYNNLSKYTEGIHAGIEALKIMGVTISENPSIFKLAYYFLKLKLTTTPAKIEKLKTSLQPVKNEEERAIIQLMATMCATAYASNQKLFLLMIFLSYEASIKYGYDEYYDVLNTPALLFILANDYKRAGLFIDLSQLIYEKDPNNISAIHLSAMGTFGTHWRWPFTVSLDYLDRCYLKTLEAGDFVYANYCRAVRVFSILEETGKTVSEMLPEAESYLEFTKRSKDQNHEVETVMQLIYLHYIHGDDPTTTEADFVSKIDTFTAETVGPLIASTGYIFKGQSLYILGNYEGALKAWEDFYQYRNYSMILAYIGKCYLFHGLTIGACYPNLPHKEKKKQWKRLLQLEKQLKIWAENSPVNYLHKALILSAEVQRIKGDYLLATKLYTKAIEETQTLGVIEYAAVAAERLGQLYLDLGYTRIAKTYLQEAHYGYNRWCAFRKVAQMEEIFPDWLKNKDPSTIGEGTTVGLSTTTTASVDFLSILKSSQAISSEIVLDKLLQSLLGSVIENAGAQKGALIIDQQNHLLVIAEGEIGIPLSVNAKGIPLEKNQTLPQAVITYVQRSHENVVLQDALKAEKFQQDPYIASAQPKSLLCVPILHQNRISGYIYLENRLTTGAFTAERLKVLQLLAGQAAISLENARLYAACGRFVPYEFLEQIKKRNLIEVQLGDQIQREMTVLFCDIRGFTTLSEKMTPSEVFKLINSFLGCMGPVVKKNNGFIDKYIGDAIMALFLSPDDAVQAAIDMIDELKEFNEKFNTSLGIGIGINTGELMLGIIGEQDRLEGSVLGDAVNVASRIESLTRQLQADILVSEATRERLNNSEGYTMTDVGEAPLKGKAKLVKIWSVKKA